MKVVKWRASEVRDLSASFAEMTALLVEKPCTVRSLAQHLGTRPTTVARRLSHYRARGLIFVEAYVQCTADDGRLTKLMEAWRWGPGMGDAEKPVTPWMAKKLRVLRQRGAVPRKQRPMVDTAADGKARKRGAVAASAELQRALQAWVEARKST